MTFHAALYQQDVIRRVLMLREDLVRHDENLAAFDLLDRAVPYFVADHPAIIDARRDQYEMVRHVLPRDRLLPEDRERDFYAEYYASNPHEAPFEEQYGISVEQSHAIPRVEFLRQGLDRQADLSRDHRDIGWGQLQIVERKRIRGQLRTIDLSANDGWMAARLSLDGYTVDCLDLHPGNVELARERKKTYPLMGDVRQGALEDVLEIFGGPADSLYDAVACFETLEHVRDPRAAVYEMTWLVKPGARIYVSVPNGAVESGNVPEWSKVESKGHVRVFTPDSLRSLLQEFGEVEQLVEGEDGVLCARVRPG